MLPVAAIAMVSAFPLFLLILLWRSRADRRGSAVAVPGLLQAPRLTAADPDEHDDGQLVLRPSEAARFRRGRVVSLLLGAVLLAIGCYMLAMHSPFHALISTWRYQHWPKATATIVKYDGKRSGRTSPSWRVYRYELQGHQYEGHGPYLAGFKNRPLDMPVGMKVTIAYNPGNPEQVLSEADSRVDLFRYDGLILVAPTALFGVFCGVAAFQGVRAQKTPQRRRGRPDHL